MGFSQEIKDFTGGFATGWKLATPSEAAERRREKAEDNANVDARRDEKLGQGIVTAPHIYASGDGSTTVSGIRTGGINKRGEIGSETETKFVDALKAGGLTNPNGLAAVAAYANHESAYAPSNITGSWADPSQSGQPGRSGGILSWREERLDAMRKATAGQSDPVLAQAKFTLAENPDLTKALQNAKTPEEANDLMAKAWKFAGYDKTDGGEYAARLATTKEYYNKYGAPVKPPVTAVTTGPQSFSDMYPEEAKKAGLTTASYAEGGTVMSDEEFMRAARAAAMDSQDAPVQQPGGWTDPTVPAPAETPTIGAPEAVQAQATQTVPLPPRRPGAIELGPRPEAQYASLPGQAKPETAQRAIQTQQAPQAPAEAEYDPKSMNVFSGIHEAIDAGLKAIQASFGFDDKSRALPTGGDYPQRVAQLSRNEGAATPAEVRQIDDTVDPKRQLTADARAVARMYAGYEYFAERGEFEKAQNYSKSLLLYVRGHMQMAGAVAEDHIKNGDIKGAARAITEAHNQVPDGSTMYVDKVGPDGKVDYRMMDSDGDLTERGQASVNQLMQLAVGMKNGSEWFNQMNNARAGSLTAAQKLAEKRRTQDEGALKTFNTEDDGDFQKSLTDNQREAFNKMSPAVQNHLRNEFHRRQSERAAGEAATKRDALNEKRQERADRRMEMRENQEDTKSARAEKELTDSQEWSAHTDAIRDAQDALNDQMADDPEDAAKIKPLQDNLRKATGAASDWMKGDGGRTKYGKELRDLTKPQRGSAAQAGGAAPTSRGGGTASEREKNALEQKYVSLERKVRREGNTEEGQAQLRAARAEVEFNKRDKGYDDDMKAQVDGVMPGIFGVDDVSKIDPKKKPDLFDYNDAVSGILRGDNGIPPEQAAAIAKEAATTGKITRLDDGRYSVNGSRPVFISPEGIRAIAAIAQRNKPAVKPTTRVSNPFDDGESTLSPAAQEQATEDAQRQAVREGGAKSRQLQRKQSERETLIKDLGADYKPAMTMAQMRRARLDRIQRNRRLGIEGSEYPDPNRP